MKNYVAIGDLILDIYYDEFNNRIGYYPGGSVWNDLFNLRNIDTDNMCYGIGTCGQDESSDYIKCKFAENGINMDNVVDVDKPTNKFHIIVNGNQTVCQSECPICKNKARYSSSRYPKRIPSMFNNLTGEKYIILDSLKNSNINLAQSFLQNGWKLAVDIGYINYFRYLSKSKLEELFSFPIFYLQIKANVARFLIKKFELVSTEMLFSVINVTYLCVTDGEKGSTFYWKDSTNNVTSNYCESLMSFVVDPTGAGDAFFSMMLYNMDYSGGFINNIEIIQTTATEYACNVIKSIGAQEKCEDKKFYAKGCPNCGFVETNSKKTVSKRQTIAINTTHLYNRIVRALDSDAEDKLRNAIRNLSGNIVMVGTGGSYSAAIFASKVLNEYMVNVYSSVCHPREFMFENMEKVSAVFLFSYSGKTNDIQSVYRLCKKLNIPVYVITKMSYEKAMNYYSSMDDVISYSASKINSNERGFISMAGTIIPMVLFGKIFYDKGISTFEEFLKNCFAERTIEYNDEFGFSLSKDQKLVVDIFSGADTKCAAVDLESKIVESGIGRAIIHDKKDFSHGRFNVLEECKPSIIVYFDNCSGQYSKQLKKYLEKREQIPLICIKSLYGNIWGDLDLTIAVQFLTKKLSKIMEYDMARPNYPQDAMKLYKYNKDDIL